MQKPALHMGWGIFLIVVGGLFLFGNLSETGMEFLWPAFPLAVGIAFWVGFYLDRKNFGLVMPGTILTVVSLLFFYCNVFGWESMSSLWPVFILAPALGFIALYFAGTRDQGLLWPAGVMGIIGIIFIFFSAGFGDYWPIFFIVAGVLLILSSSLKRPQIK